MKQLEGRINNQILVCETYLRDFLWNKCPRTISCHKTMVARFFLFQWGWNFNLFLWFWHLGVPWVGVSLLTFFSLFQSNSFLWTWFWVSNWSFWNCGSFCNQLASRSCLWYLLKSLWIKFEVNKSYMYIKYSNSKELSSQGKSCSK